MQFNSHEELHRFFLHHAELLDKEELIVTEALLEAVRTRHHLKYNKGSLFEYVLDFTSWSRSKTYAFTKVAKKAGEIPQLAESMKKKEITFWVANRLCSTITAENAGELLEFAKTHSKDEVDQKALNKSGKKVLFYLQDEDYAWLKRAKSVAAQKTRKPVGIADMSVLTYKYYVQGNDPVEKAKRNYKPEKVQPHAKPTRHQRKRLSAQEKHAVNFYTQGRCTYVENGKRCEEDKWVHIHHIVPVSMGGTNEPSNLTLLCSRHHDLVHQIEFPFMKQKHEFYRPRI
jgi:hypothetical protein